MKPLRLLALGVMCAALPAACGLAEGETPRPVPVRATTGGPAGEGDFARECSACHMAYPAALLPARSWRALTSHLSTHFGEDASLDAPTTQRITGYLVSHAADSSDGSPGVMRGLPAGQTPERITDMPFWRRIHDDLLEPGVGTGPGLRSAANCMHCHNGSGGDD